MMERLRQPWLLAPLILVLDFVSKRLVLANEQALRAKISVIGDFARFIYVRNPGSAMGLFPVGRVVLVAVSLAATVFLVWPDHEEALPPGSLKGAAINAALITPVFHVRHNFFRQKLPVGIPK